MCTCTCVRVGPAEAAQLTLVCPEPSWRYRCKYPHRVLPSSWAAENRGHLRCHVTEYTWQTPSCPLLNQQALSTRDLNRPCRVPAKTGLSRPTTGPQGEPSSGSPRVSPRQRPTGRQHLDQTTGRSSRAGTSPQGPRAGAAFVGLVAQHRLRDLRSHFSETIPALVGGCTRCCRGLF